MSVIAQKITYTALFIAVMAFTACSSQPPQPTSQTNLQINEIKGETAASTKAVECPDSRPQLCTMIYLPVCALGKDGIKKTAGSSCTACATDNIVSYTVGTCESHNEMSNQ